MFRQVQAGPEAEAEGCEDGEDLGTTLHRALQAPRCKHSSRTQISSLLKVIDHIQSWFRTNEWLASERAQTSVSQYRLEIYATIWGKHLWYWIWIINQIFPDQTQPHNLGRQILLGEGQEEPGSPSHSFAPQLEQLLTEADTFPQQNWGQTLPPRMVSYILFPLQKPGYQTIANFSRWMNQPCVINLILYIYIFSPIWTIRWQLSQPAPQPLSPP